MDLLEELVLASTYVRADDETRHPRADCDGKGHAWAASCPWASMIIFHKSRSGDIFDGALRFLRGAVAVVDGYVVYRGVLKEIQRCWRHIINNLKAAAVRSSGPGAENVRVQYGRLCGLYERIKNKDTASESERAAILAEVRRIATALPEDHPSRIEILNAGDALVTFLKYAGMPPTNNPGEGVIRRGPVRHRNVRYLLRNEEGARVLGILLSFHVTCRMQGLDPVETGQDTARRQPALHLQGGAAQRRRRSARKDRKGRRVAPAGRPRPDPSRARIAPEPRPFPCSHRARAQTLPVLASRQPSAFSESGPEAPRAQTMPVLASRQKPRAPWRNPAPAADLQRPAKLSLPANARRAYAAFHAALVLSAAATAASPACGWRRSPPGTAPRRPPPRPAHRIEIAARVGLRPRQPPLHRRRPDGQTPIEPPVPPPCTPGGAEGRAVRAASQGMGCKHARGRQTRNPSPTGV